MIKKCIVCGNDFVTHNNKFKCCSKECSKIRASQRYRERTEKRRLERKAGKSKEKINVETIKACRHPDCRFHGDQSCDYILITGHMRNSPISNCDKYEEGPRPQDPLTLPPVFCKDYEYK